MYIIRIFLFIFLTSCSLNSFAQTLDSSKIIEQLPAKYYAEVNKKLSDVNEKLSKKSLKYLSKFQRQDQKIRKKLRKLNPDTLLANANEKYGDTYKKLKSSFLSKKAFKITGMLPNKSLPQNGESTSSAMSGAYNPYLDSLATSLSFLNQFNSLSDKLQQPLANLQSLKANLQQTEKIKEFIAERKNQIKEALSKYTKLPAALKGQYEKISKTAYYYSAQVKEYKDMLKDPKKAEQKALALLNKLPAFQKFWQRNSYLAMLFPQQGAPNSLQGIAGLQTNVSVQQIIQQRIQSGGPNARAQLRQNIVAGQAELNKLKDKINSFGGSGDIDIPDFKPSEKKAKSFSQRLEYSADIQLQKSNKLLPSAANLGMGIGYKLNDKSTAGIGLSYKLGMGSIQHISFSSQAIGFRSFMDWKLKKQIYISGGYEMNYNAAFRNIEQLRNLNAWQRSGLMGLGKKYQVSKKIKGEMKLLYDFLANTHIPVSDPLVFRVGYKF